MVSMLIRSRCTIFSNRRITLLVLTRMTILKSLRPSKLNLKVKLRCSLIPKFKTWYSYVPTFIIKISHPIHIQCPTTGQWPHIIKWGEIFQHILINNSRHHWWESEKYKHSLTKMNLRWNLWNFHVYWTLTYQKSKNS